MYHDAHVCCPNREGGLVEDEGRWLREFQRISQITVENRQEKINFYSLTHLHLTHLRLTSYPLWPDHQRMLDSIYLSPFAQGTEQLGIKFTSDRGKNVFHPRYDSICKLYVLFCPNFIQGSTNFFLTDLFSSLCWQRWGLRLLWQRLNNFREIFKFFFFKKPFLHVHITQLYNYYKIN